MPAAGHGAHRTGRRGCRVARRAVAVVRPSRRGDVEGHGELDAEITRLNELRMTALEARIHADMAPGATAPSGRTFARR